MGKHKVPPASLQSTSPPIPDVVLKKRASQPEDTRSYGRRIFPNKPKPVRRKNMLKNDQNRALEQISLPKPSDVFWDEKSADESVVIHENSVYCSKDYSHTILSKKIYKTGKIHLKITINAEKHQWALGVVDWDCSFMPRWPTDNRGALPFLQLQVMEQVNFHEAVQIYSEKYMCGRPIVMWLVFKKYWDGRISLIIDLTSDVKTITFLPENKDLLDAFDAGPDKEYAAAWEKESNATPATKTMLLPKWADKGIKVAASLYGKNDSVTVHSVEQTDVDASEDPVTPLAVGDMVSDPWNLSE